MTTCPSCGHVFDEPKHGEAYSTAFDVPRKPDMVDAFLRYQIKPASIRNSIEKHFRLTPNWSTKTARQFLEWAHEIDMKDEQIERAARTWRNDKRFNWKQPDLVKIHEWWRDLTAVVETHAAPNPMASFDAYLERREHGEVR